MSLATARWVLLPTDYDGGLTDDQLVAVVQGARAWQELVTEQKLYPRWSDAILLGIDKLGLAHAQSTKRLGEVAIERLMAKRRGERFH